MHSKYVYCYNSFYSVLSTESLLGVIVTPSALEGLVATMHDDSMVLTNTHFNCFFTKTPVNYNLILLPIVKAHYIHFSDNNIFHNEIVVTIHVFEIKKIQLKE